jgi:formylglycine-generating enzyme required for sulfatase activity
MVFRKSDFIRIRAGNYSIGLTAAALEKASGKMKDSTIKKEFLASSFPGHTVHIDEIFISKQLTTLYEFSAFAEDTGYITEGEKQGWGWIWQDERWQKKTGVSWKRPFGTADDERYRQDDTLPVMQVSWHDAAAYCSWLSVKSGITVRLPREAEWEIFAGLCGVPGIVERADDLSQVPVPATVLGALRMGVRSGVGGINAIGLLWEWTEDWYDRYPGGTDQKDYGTVYKVLRGGSILSLPAQRTREFRLRKCPTARSPYYGFRIACSGIPA